MTILRKLPTLRHKKTPRVCEATGLLLLPAIGQKATRIAKLSWGAMNPQVRPTDGDRAAWGRYDVPGHRTIYGGAPTAAAYAEALANQRIPLGVIPKLSDLFDDTDADDARTVLDALNTEWEAMFRMGKGKLVAGWRDARLEYTLTLPDEGWLIDIEAPESIEAIGQALGPELSNLGVQHLTIGHLRGEDRAITTTIAAWIHNQTLADGSLPHGIHFGSKHGNDLSCCAVWLRRMDDGKNLVSEPTTADCGREILRAEQNPPLERVATLFHLRVL